MKFYFRYGPVVQNLIKFPAVFKMDPATIKVTQSFWYLDHGDLDVSFLFSIKIKKKKI